MPKKTPKLLTPCFPPLGWLVQHSGMVNSRSCPQLLSCKPAVCSRKSATTSTSIQPIVTAGMPPRSERDPGQGEKMLLVALAPSTRPAHSTPKTKCHTRHLLPTTCCPWSHNSVDFATGLLSSEVSTTVMTKVDRFSKMAHFVACLNYIQLQNLQKFYFTIFFVFMVCQ